MSADLLRRAAGKLRERATDEALALARLLEVHVQVAEASDAVGERFFAAGEVIDIARAILREPQ